MTLLTALALVCAVLTSAIALPEETDGSAQLADSSDLVKRWFCGTGWTAYNSHCFRYFPRPTTWGRAEKNCQSLGGNLASVHNFQEYHELQRLITTASHEFKETWLGGSDAQEEGKWFWIDGTRFDYTDWCDGEPNNSQQQNCMQMNHRGEKCWDDIQCNVKRPSVCVKNM